MEHLEDVAKKLNRLASSQSYHQQREKIIEIITSQQLEVKSILDVGCGNGSLCRDFRNKFPDSRIVGVDISKDNLDIAEKLHSKNNIEYYKSDTRSLPFDNETFDVVICANTLKYLGTEENEITAVKEQLRILKSGGLLLITDGDDENIRYSSESMSSKNTIKEYAKLQGDTRCGSRLLSIAKLVDLKYVKTDTIVLKEDSFNEKMAGRIMAENIRDVINKNEWFNELEKHAIDNTYYWTYVKFIIYGRK